MSNNQLLTQDEAAALLSLSPITLEKWRGLRKGPPYVRLGSRTVRYQQEALSAWIAGNVTQQTNMETK